MKVEREILLTLEIEYRPRKEFKQTLTDPGEPGGYDIIKVLHNGVELDLSKEDEEAIEQELIDDEPDADDDVNDDDCRDDRDLF